MSWLGKSVGNHIAGANKYLHKTINNGSHWLGKLHQTFNSVKDKYASTKKESLGSIGEYNPKLRALAETGVNLVENEVENFVNPFKHEVQPLYNLGSNIGKLLKNY